MRHDVHWTAVDAIPSTLTVTNTDAAQPVETRSDAVAELLKSLECLLSQPCPPHEHLHRLPHDDVERIRKCAAKCS